MKIKPDDYKNLGEQLVRVKKMKQGEWVRWITAFWKEAYITGYKEAKEDSTQEGVVVPDDVDAQVLTYDGLYDVLLSVKGIGQKRARQVIDILTGGEDAD